MSKKLLHFLALQLTPGIGNTNAKYIISHLGDPEVIFNAKKKDLARVPGIGQKTIQSILSRSAIEKAEKIIEECARKEIDILHYTSEKYPSRLKTLLDAPPILYFKGQGDLNPRYSISIVGTRKATDYGRRVVDHMIMDLCEYGPTVISGLAYGIDIESHRKSLEYGLPTIAVLAGGLDEVYPRAHMNSVNQMMESGGILSEYPPGIKPEAPLFPARNRIIAGLGDATVVVEAAARGGALITANLADSYNRPVFSVPGNLDQHFSIGCNRLIRSQKALAFTEVNDIVYYLNWVKKVDAEKKAVPDLSKLDDDQRKIIELLMQTREGLAIDEISWKTQLQINHLATVLLSMEFDGLLKCLPGKKYRLK